MDQVDKYFIIKLAQYSGSNDVQALLPTPLFGNIPTGKKHPGAFSRDYRKVQSTRGKRTKQQPAPIPNKLNIPATQYTQVANMYRQFRGGDFGQLPVEEQKKLYGHWSRNTKGGQFAHRFVPNAK